MNDRGEELIRYRLSRAEETLEEARLLAENKHGKKEITTTSSSSMRWTFKSGYRKRNRSSGVFLN